MSDSDPIDEVAARWLVRRDARTLSKAETAEFESWLVASPRHRQAYVALARAWERCDELAPSPLTSRDDSRVTTPTNSRTRWRFAAAACVLALMLPIALLIAWRVPQLRGWQTYRTEIGGFQRVVLRDGSIAELNTDSELAVRMTSDHRELRLLRGEVAFDVAHEAHRPFDVVAGGRVVRAVGTAFSVRLRGADSMELTVSEGRVVVGEVETLRDATPNHPSGAPLVVAGQIGVAGPTGIAVHTAAPDDLRKNLAWHDGDVVFDGQTLQQAIAEINRYNARQLRIDDPGIAALRVGGRFHATDLDTFIRTLGPSFGLRVVVSNDGQDLLLIR